MSKPKLFGIPVSCWDKFKGKVCTVKCYEMHSGIPTVRILEDDKNYFWPAECFVLHIPGIPLPSGGPFPCDCPLNIVLSQGCKRKDHY